MTKNEFVASFRREILPAIIHNEFNGPDYPARRQAWNDTIDALIKDGILPERAGNWQKPADIEGKPTKRAQAANIDHPDAIVRYAHLDPKDPDYKAKCEAQWNQAERDANAGKRICISDLMISAGM